jgi:hypothetical protein
VFEPQFTPGEYRRVPEPEPGEGQRGRSGDYRQRDAFVNVGWRFGQAEGGEEAE